MTLECEKVAESQDRFKGCGAGLDKGFKCTRKEWEKMDLKPLSSPAQHPLQVFQSEPQNLPKRTFACGCKCFLCLNVHAGQHST